MEIVKKIENFFDIRDNIVVIDENKINEKYPKGTMNFYCKKSIRMLKKYTVNHNKLPNKKEWNDIAKKNNLLSSESLKYICNIKL